MNKQEVVKELLQCDHCFITPEDVEEFTKPFGFKGSTFFAVDNRSEFKGLNLGTDYKEGDKAEGQDADRTACEIARHIGADYTSMHGRGSALRECCRAIADSLKD